MSTARVNVLTAPASATMAPSADLTSYYAIHAALRTGARRLAAATARVNRMDRVAIKALGTYWKGYAGEVEAHHTTEDQIFFPALLERAPEVAGHLERVARDHALLDELDQVAAAAMDNLVHGAHPGAAAAAFHQLSVHMAQHLDFEDADLVPLFAVHFDQEDYTVLEDGAMKLLGVGKQAAFTVPFVMASVSEADQDHLLSGAPFAFRVLYHLTRPSHARLLRRAFGPEVP